MRKSTLMPGFTMFAFDGLRGLGTPQPQEQSAKLAGESAVLVLPDPNARLYLPQAGASPLEAKAYVVDREILAKVIISTDVIGGPGVLRRPGELLVVTRGSTTVALGEPVSLLNPISGAREPLGRGVQVVAPAGSRFAVLRASAGSTGFLKPGNGNGNGNNGNGNGSGGRSAWLPALIGISALALTVWLVFRKEKKP